VRVLAEDAVPHEHPPVYKAGLCDNYGTVSCIAFRVETEEIESSQQPCKGRSPPWYMSPHVQAGFTALCSRGCQPLLYQAR
jgi:hypothetical protein